MSSKENVRLTMWGTCAGEIRTRLKYRNEYKSSKRKQGYTNVESHTQRHTPLGQTLCSLVKFEKMLAKWHGVKPIKQSAAAWKDVRFRMIIYHADAYYTQIGASCTRRYSILTKYKLVLLDVDHLRGGEFALYCVSRQQN